MSRPERLLLATRNGGKVREMRAMLRPLGVELVGVGEWEAAAGPAPDVAETGTTFSANALLKARGYAAWSGLPVIAEDSGLAVDALDGAPGVYSARFAGVDGDDAANNAKLLAELAGVPAEERTARYHTAAVYLAAAGGEPLTVHGTWEGRILEAPRGTGGFGYDPLFWVPTHGCASAELDPAEKNRLSHRGQAVRELVAELDRRWAGRS